MRVNPGVSLYLNRLVWYTRLLGSGPLVGRAVDQRGLRGAVNLVFGQDAAWHCLFSDSGFRFFHGRHAEPIGAVSLESDVFLRMLAGQLSYYTAEMTGKVRIEGVAHSAWVMSTLIMRSRDRARRGGIGGWITRWAIRRALRRSGTGHELTL
jgi:hypothetical protein